MYIKRHKAQGVEKYDYNTLKVSSYNTCLKTSDIENPESTHSEINTLVKNEKHL